jgi:hypothetical protein
MADFEAFSPPRCHDSEAGFFHLAVNKKHTAISSNPPHFAPKKVKKLWPAVNRFLPRT